MVLCPLPPHAHWERLDEGWVCLNTDGAVSSSTGYGSVGGIFRTHDGSWLLGFNKSVGVIQSFQSKLWAIFYGLQIARDNGFVHLLIQTDCLEAVTRLNAPSAGSDVNALVRAIVRLRSAGETTIVRWIPRVENKLAVAMAKLDAIYDLNLFPAAPMSLLPYLVSAVSV
ncbi:hypothetical protein V6N12_004417 [Hibiscus sabdariffa]|uniref:RNase H type-1 domain-containing protein n=1 Tax=Hibiscus sabdariffa TaxID=183260 RepID=A0ABR2CLF5_9ROSI